MHNEFGGTVIGALAVGLALAGLTPAQAQAVTDVPCNVPGLISAVTAAGGSGDTLSLAPSCRYRLTAGLPVIRPSLTIDGRGATLRAQHGAGHQSVHHSSG